MKRAFRTAAAVSFVAMSVVAVVYVLGVRWKSSIVRNAARRYHRAVGNPLQMRSAGTRGSAASVIGHRGRTSGRSYANPVWAMPTEDGFVIALVYDAATEWLKNVMASGSATIVYRGTRYVVDHPEIVPMESARSYFPATIRRLQRPVRVERCLRVRLADSAAGHHRGRAARTPAHAM